MNRYPLVPVFLLSLLAVSAEAVPPSGSRLLAHAGTCTEIICQDKWPALSYTQRISDRPSSLGGCPIFPADNIWNVPVDNLPVDPRSDDYIASIGPATGLHPDFGAGQWDGGPIGIPYNLVPSSQPLVDVSFDYAGESDPGPYPIPPDPLIEGGPQGDGDRHILILDTGGCLLYELFYAFPQNDGSWHAGSGAIFDLRSNALRPATWTSADAAGLPILAGLARYDEVAAGHIDHALRFTASQTRGEFIWPARHEASDILDPAVPPMGQRFRLKASFDITPFSPHTQVILQALKTYGMILADNGSDWYISGAPDERWINDVLVSELRQVPGSEFEAVDVSSLMVDQDSGQARRPEYDNRLWLPLVVSGGSFQQKVPGNDGQ